VGAQVSDEATHRFSLKPATAEAEGASRRRCEYWMLACSLLPELTNTVHLLEEAIKEERLTRRQNFTLLAKVSCFHHRLSSADLPPIQTRVYVVNLTVDSLRLQPLQC
jgi:hypothetical protein